MSSTDTAKGSVRKPPLQLAARLRRFLGGNLGWSGVLVQVIFIAVVIWLAREIDANVRINLQTQNIASGFGFLTNTAGFAVSQSLIPYTESDSYLRVLVVGLLNTLFVSGLGIVLASIIGFGVALGRLSPNWLLSKIATGYVELIRNLPLLFQLLFWYLAALASLPLPRQSISIFSGAFLNNRGLVVPKPIANDDFGVFVAAIVIGVIVSLVMRAYARRRLFKFGQRVTIWPYVLVMLIGLPALVAVLFGKPVTFEVPELKGLNFAGGTRVIPEFVALLIGLSTYTAAFIAEIVRAGILSVSKGQLEAGSAIGLTRGQALRLVVIPQAMRVILPPLTNQYLNLTKNSSLAVAIGYPELYSVLSGATLSQTGQAVEIVIIMMGIYLTISLFTSALMSLYAWRLDRRLVP